MARYVLVEFDDNAKAKAFVEKVNGEYGMPQNPERGFRVRAVWGKPTKFCDCIGARKGMFPYFRAPKSGWWVHSDCGRPNKHWARGNHWFAALGNNLLPGNTDFRPGDPPGSSWGYL